MRTAFALCAIVVVTLVISLFGLIQSPHATGIVSVKDPTLGTYSSGNSFNVVLASAPQVGDVLICLVATRNDLSPFVTVSSIADGNGRTTWKIQESNTVNDFYYYDVEIWLGVINAAGASSTITVTLNATVSNADAYVAEYSGMATSSFLDKTALNNDEGTESDTGTTATTTQANELWIGATVASAPQSNPTNGFTLWHYADRACDLGYFEKIVNSTGTADTGASLGPYIHPWEGCIATFFAASTPMMPTLVSVSTNSPNSTLGTPVDINGTLQDVYGNGLANEPVVLYYTFPGVSSWFPISSGITDNLGDYYVKWIPQATGYFTIMAEWTGNATYSSAKNTATLSILP